MDPGSGMKEFEPRSIQRETLVDIQGVPLFSTTLEKWDPLWSFKARPDDLLICTYPKAGTTWLQEIVEMVRSGGDPQKCARAPIYRRIPFIDLVHPVLSGLEDAEAMPSPRTLKTHFPVQLVPPSFWEQNCKVRTIAWGSWFDHVKGWWEAKDRHPILYLFYEDMKEDLAQEIRKVAHFLDVELPEPILNKIVHHTTFDNMKANPMANYSTVPPSMMDPAVSTFMRKGTVGDWKDHFTVAQSEHLDVVCARELGGSGLTFRTEL
ncbi:PREDICTED: sulfotransferase 1C1-like [Gekko japonicus]|uniref:Sulfotransferase n=1 Tax=Gekko japonicus TaxID=146911 RepID=A0ABM1KUA6_GEKJA|nr:PREDICTED: sulfotransferase 1C1-like [Gekko japonicus]